MSRMTGIPVVEVQAHKDRNLDQECYRGSAPLAHLAMISQPDIFDQLTNPEGLQRDLSPSHANDAYNYAAKPADSDWPRAFPEVVLNVRKKSAVKITRMDEGDLGSNRWILRFDANAIRAGDITVSRVDGNHRLYYAAGDDRHDPLLADAPFQIHFGLTREQEAKLFVDINHNQKGMNTSHLHVLQNRLTPEQQEIKENPDRWIAMRLAEEADSPWHGLVHLGGSKQSARLQGLTRSVSLASLQAGVKRTLQKSQYIHDLTDIQAQYALIRNYWMAVKKVFSEEWANPKEYLLLKNVGVWSVSFLGGTIIDRCVPRGKFTPDDMAYYLTQCRARWDWDKRVATGDRSVAGMSGNRAAMIVAAAMAEELTDESGESVIRDLSSKLLADSLSE